MISDRTKHSKVLLAAIVLLSVLPRVRGLPAHVHRRSLFSFANLLHHQVPRQVAAEDDASTSSTSLATVSEAGEIMKETVALTTTTFTSAESVPTPGPFQAPLLGSGMLYFAPPSANPALPTALDLPQMAWDIGGGLDALASWIVPHAQQRPSESATSPASAPLATGPGHAAGEGPEPGQASSASESVVVAAYYADWAANQLPPEGVDFSRFNWIDFAFAVPNENFEISFTQPNSEDVLNRLVAAAHAQGRKVKLSIGGWTGSAHFSRAVSSGKGRSKLCQSILRTYQRHDLDGIDVDWEYPNGTGAGNEKSPDDTTNFLKFLKLLRKRLPPTARITAATQVWPFAGKDGQPITDARAFALVLDWILVMNYDVWGSSASPGPNAPLSDGCGNSSQPLANAEAAIRSWTNSGFPARQIVLGVPAYGYVSRSESLKLATRGEWAGPGRVAGEGRQEQQPSSEQASPPSSSSSGGGESMGTMSNAIELKGDDGSGDAGQIQFNQLVAQGALVRNNGGDYDGAGGFERRWDACSSTPWLRSEARKQIVTYDDPESMRLKGELGQKAGILGINLFAAHGDDSWVLVDAARRGLGVMGRWRMD